MTELECECCGYKSFEESDFALSKWGYITLCVDCKQKEIDEKLFIIKCMNCGKNHMVELMKTDKKCKCGNRLKY